MIEWVDLKFQEAAPSRSYALNPLDLRSRDQVAMDLSHERVGSYLQTRHDPQVDPISGLHLSNVHSASGCGDISKNIEHSAGGNSARFQGANFTQLLGDQWN
jgi:hypothetical protein